MALIGNIAISMQANTAGWSKGLALASRELSAFQRLTAPAIGGVGMLGGALKGAVGATREAVNELGGFGVVLAGIGAAGFTNIVKGGMALGEQTDRARITFGKYSDTVINASDQMAKAFGVSKREFIQSASAMGQIFQGAGYDEEAAAGLSVHFVKLAADLSSFAHIPMEEAMHKIQSGLVGMARPLREVGVLMSDEAVKAYAAKNGIAALGTELTESQKVQARAGLITQELGKAQGNLALTSTSAANQVRALAGRFENLKDSIGSSLIAVVVGPLSDLQTGLEALQMAWDNSAYAANNATIGVVGATHEQVQAIGWVQKGIGMIADGWDVMRLGFAATQSYITAGLGKLVEGIAFLSSGFDAISQKFGGGKSGATEWLNAIGEDLKRLSGDQWEGFQKKLTEPWPSEGINEFFANARNKTLALQADMSKAKTDISGFKPKVEALPKPGELHANKAMREGSQEAVNTILRSQFGAGTKNDAAKETAKNTAKAVEYLAKIASSSVSGALSGTPLLWQDLP